MENSPFLFGVRRRDERWLWSTTVIQNGKWQVVGGNGGVVEAADGSMVRWPTDEAEEGAGYATQQGILRGGVTRGRGRQRGAAILIPLSTNAEEK